MAEETNIVETMEATAQAAQDAATAEMSPQAGEAVIVVDVTRPETAEVVTLDLSEMTPAEASQFEREYYLGGPDFVLPDGRTKGDVEREAYERDRELVRERREADTAERASRLASGMSPLDEPHRAMRVGFVGGQLISQPVSNETAEGEALPVVSAGVTVAIPPASPGGVGPASASAGGGGRGKGDGLGLKVLP